MKPFILSFIVFLLAACAPAAPTDLPATPVATGVPTSDSAAFPLRAAIERDKGWVCPPEFAGQALHVANWDVYIADDAVANFETLCDVTVTYTTYTSNEEMIDQLRAGNAGYDVIFPSDYAVALLISEERLRPLNFANIPNRAHVFPDLLNLTYDAEGLYSVPYHWGTIGVVYNIAETNTPILSWAQFFEYEGSVAWFDDATGMIGLALRQLEFDPNSQDPGEIEAARDYLIAHSENVTYITGDEFIAPYVDGVADIGISYNGTLYLLAQECECDNFRYSIPEDGSALWMDYVAVPVDAPNPRLAEAFIDYLMTPQVAADNANFAAYATPNLVALNIGLIDPLLRDDPGTYPSDEVRRNLYPSNTDPAVQQIQVEAWEAVKAAIGR